MTCFFQGYRFVTEGTKNPAFYFSLFLTASPASFHGLALSHTAPEIDFHKRTAVSSGVAYTLTVTVQKKIQPLQIVLEQS